MAVVTGASSGIGRAVAKALAGTGVGVVLAARRADRLEALADEIDGDGGHARSVPTDVTDRGAVEALVERTVDAMGSLDILVNNAGVMLLSPMEQVRVEEWERMVDVNVKGVLFGLAAALPVMIEQGGGHVVNIGSLAGRRPFPGGAVYSATKFAVRSLTWGLQLELSAAKGVRMTDVQPGVVDTELTDHVTAPGVRKRFEDGWRGKRKLAPADVARAVLFAVTAPEHVNVNEILVRPTDQET